MPINSLSHFWESPRKTAFDRNRENKRGEYPTRSTRGQRSNKGDLQSASLLRKKPSCSVLILSPRGGLFIVRSEQVLALITVCLLGILCCGSVKAHRSRQIRHVNKDIDAVNFLIESKRELENALVKEYFVQPRSDGSQPRLHQQLIIDRFQCQKQPC